MQLEVGSVVEGKVTGITKFGAFVSLPGGKSGLVHISEIANTYVSDINDHLSEGSDVKVKVIGIAENGKVNLSIKKAVEQPRRIHVPRHGNPPPAADSFEDKLKQFMQDSDSRMSGSRLYSDRKSSSRKRRD